MFFNSLMEMTSSVPDIICIAQITFKLINNTLPSNDGWFPLLNLKLLANFWTREYRLYWIADVVAKINYHSLSLTIMFAIKRSMIGHDSLSKPCASVANWYLVSYRVRL